VDVILACSKSAWKAGGFLAIAELQMLSEIEAQRNDGHDQDLDNLLSEGSRSGHQGCFSLRFLV
jgi:hypothetical protein